MFELKCRDLGMDCTDVIKGTTLEEVKKKSMEHVNKAHATKMKAMTPVQLAGFDKLIETKTKKTP
jgi:predicted small metal-binding protein